MLNHIKRKSLKKLAEYYRKEGCSYGLISQKIGVAKSTLSGWLRYIPYKPNREVLKRIRNAKANSAKVLRIKKKENIIKIKKSAEVELDKITKRDLWMIGIGLYIGEGSKNEKGPVRVVNSDPEVIKLFINWFKNVCNLSVDNFNLAVYIYPDNNLEQTLRYWSKVTGIPRNQFGKTQIDKRINKSLKNKNKLKYGTACLTIHSNGKITDGIYLLRRIFGWIEHIEKQVNAGMVQW